MKIHSTSGFEIDDIEGVYCYLENSDGTHIATISILNNIITIEAARSDYQSSIDITGYEYDDDTLDEIEETLFAPAGWIVSRSFLEQLMDECQR